MSGLFLNGIYFLKQQSWVTVLKWDNLWCWNRLLLLWNEIRRLGRLSSHHLDLAEVVTVPSLAINLLIMRRNWSISVSLWSVYIDSLASALTLDWVVVTRSCSVLRALKRAQIVATARHQFVTSIVDPIARLWSNDVFLRARDRIEPWAHDFLISVVLRLAMCVVSRPFATLLYLTLKLLILRLSINEPIFEVSSSQDLLSHPSWWCWHLRASSVFLLLFKHEPH